MVSVKNEWGPLEEVMLGSAVSLTHPGPSPFDVDPGFPFWMRAYYWCVGTFLGGRAFHERTRVKFQKEIEALEAVLSEQGVAVRHPMPIAPHPGEPKGLGQLFPRDILTVVGETLVVCRTHGNSRWKEWRGIESFLREMRQAGVSIADERDAPSEVILEGGDVLVDLPNVYVGQGKYTSNAAGANWLQEALGPTVNVIPVETKQSTTLHLDCALALIGPKQAIIDRSALPDPLPAPLRDFDVIDVSAKEGMGLATNVFVVDPKTIVISDGYPDLFQALQKRGWQVIQLPFPHHVSEGGAFHCATVPLRRA